MQSMLWPKKPCLYTNSGCFRQLEDIGKLLPACSLADVTTYGLRELSPESVQHQRMLRAATLNWCRHSDLPGAERARSDSPGWIRLPGPCSNRTRFPARLQNGDGALRCERPRWLVSNPAS